MLDESSVGKFSRRKVRYKNERDRWTSEFLNMAAASKRDQRILREIEGLRPLATDPDSAKFIVEETSTKESSYVIIGRIMPRSNIYNRAAFRIEIKLLAEYPFKPPEIQFLTPIYHPNVSEKGHISFDTLCTTETYRPTTPLTDYVNTVIELIDNPNFNYPLRSGKFFR